MLQVFFWSWVVIATFLMLNIVLAIIVEAFVKIKAGLRNAPTIATEISLVSKQGARILANRLVGSEWLISDAELEGVLLAHDRRFAAGRPATLLRSAHRVRNSLRSKVVRIPGGLQVSDRDLEMLLHGQRCVGRRSVAERIRALMPKRQRRRPPASCGPPLPPSTALVRRASRRFSLTRSETALEDGVVIAEDYSYLPTAAVADLINRYGEDVADGQDDEEMLRYMQAEGLKREMALFATQDRIRQNVETVVGNLDALASAVLPAEKLTGLQRALQERKSKSVPEHKTGDSRADYVFQGTLHVTVVSAKRLPKLDIFSESDPYCVLLLEEKAPFSGCQRKPLAATEAKMNDKDPIWNSAHTFSLMCSADTALLAAVLDRDDLGGDDMIGYARVALAGLPVGKELDRWYRLRNDSTPNLARRALVRLRVLLTPSDLFTPLSSRSLQVPKVSETATSQSSLPLQRSTSQNMKITYSSASVRVRQIEVTLVSARSLPKRKSLLSKLSICDPYVQLSLGGIEFKSVVRRNTCNPDWGQSFTFDLCHVGVDESGPLHVTLFDWNQFKQHEALGEFQIPHDLLEDLLTSHPEDIHTFNLLYHGLMVQGYGGKISQVALCFRALQERPSRSGVFGGSLEDLIRAQSSSGGETFPPCLPSCNADCEVDSEDRNKRANSDYRVDSEDRSKQALPRKSSKCSLSTPASLFHHSAAKKNSQYGPLEIIARSTVQQLAPDYVGSPEADSEMCQSSVFSRSAKDSMC